MREFRRLTKDMRPARAFLPGDTRSSGQKRLTAGRCAAVLGADDDGELVATLLRSAEAGPGCSWWPALRARGGTSVRERDAPGGSLPTDAWRS